MSRWLLHPAVSCPRWPLVVLLTACSGGEGTSQGAPVGGVMPMNASSTAASGTSSTTGSATVDGTAAGSTTTGSATASTTTGVGEPTSSSSTTSAGGASSTGSTGTAGAGGGGVPLSELTLSAVPGNGTIGLEWPTIAGATSYNVYWSNTPGVTPLSGTPLVGVPRGFVHRELSNGQPYYYVVTALLPEGESAPSAEISATPDGEWVLEQLGTGDFDDVLTGNRVPSIPVAQRFHVLLVGEGYTSADLATLHDHTDHAGARDNDIDRWVDLVFSIEPYSLLPEAFVVWYLARASATSIRDANPDTAFDVPITLGGSLPQMGRPDSTGPTSVALWEAIALHPYPPAEGERTIRNFSASFLIYDPERGQASVSGLATTLTNPGDSNQRINAAFGLGHAHEFTHAFSGLRDEYLENDNSAPESWSETSNIVGSNSCAELPWAHLIAGSPLNPDVDGLVGAFGTPSIGYHSELLCLLNGTHDNGEYYGSDGSSCQQSSCTLRVEDRMCNFCREITAYQILARSGVLANDEQGFQVWKDQYRASFYQRFELQVPGVHFDGLLPQSNDVRDPEQGAQLFEACVP